MVSHMGEHCNRHAPPDKVADTMNKLAQLPADFFTRPIEQVPASLRAEVIALLTDEQRAAVWGVIK